MPYMHDPDYQEVRAATMRIAANLHIARANFNACCWGDWVRVAKLFDDQEAVIEATLAREHNCLSAWQARVSCSEFLGGFN